MKDTIIKNLRESCPWQDSLLWFDTIESTNTEAKHLARQGAAHGTVLIADHQTGGRGRRGRSFHSPAGTGIYMSVILRPRCRAEHLMHLTCAAAVAMCDAVEDAVGLRPQVKWTNDLVCGKLKIAGILTEPAFDSTGFADYAIIGIGINCNQTSTDFPEEIRDIAASLAMVTGRETDRAALAASMIKALYRMDRNLLTDQEGIIHRYRADCMTLGRDVCVVRADGSIRRGRAVDIDSTGGLIVDFPESGPETVSSGEVSVRGMYGYL